MRQEKCMRGDTAVPAAPARMLALDGETARDVLVADDTNTVRLMLTRYIEKLGHRVTAASNGRQALELLRDRDFDLVLLDVLMPEMDGYEVLEQIKSDPRL